MTTLIKRLWRNISSKRRTSLKRLLLIMIIASFAELVSIGLVVPFLSVLTSPEIILKNDLIYSSLNKINISGEDEILVFITLLFIAFTIAAGSIRVVLLKVTAKNTNLIGVEISNKIFSKMINESYQTHLSRNSSSMVSLITDKTNVVSEIISEYLSMTTSIIITLIIFFVMVFVDSIIAISAVMFFGISYWIIARIVKKRAHENSAIISKEKTKTVKITQEAIGGIRDIILDSSQDIKI